MTIIIEKIPTETISSSTAPEQDTTLRVEILSLDWQDRRKPRQKQQTVQGTEIVLALPRGTVLKDGDCLYLSDSLVIKVKAKKQDILKISPANSVEICRIAHHLGNWHRSMEVKADGSLLTEGDQPFEEWLKREKIAYESIKAPYHPNLNGAEH